MAGFLQPGDFSGNNNGDTHVRPQKQLNADPVFAAKYNQAGGMADFSNSYFGGASPSDVANWIRSLPPDQAAQVENSYWTSANAKYNPDSSMDKVMHALALTGSLVGVGLAGGAAAGLLGAAGGGAAGTVAGGTAAGATGEAALGDVAISGSMIPEAGAIAADTIPEVITTASALPSAGGLTATQAFMAAAPSFAAGALTPDTAINTASNLPKLPSQPGGLSQYMPKNLISRGLQSAGVPTPVANIAGGAAQGAGTSALRGGNPITGAIGGGFGSAFAPVGQSISSGVSDAVGNGTVGNIAGSAVSGAIGGGLGSAITGGDPLAGATSGLVGGAVGSGINATGVDPAIGGPLAGLGTGFITGAIGSATGHMNMPTNSSVGLGGSGNGSMGKLFDPNAPPTVSGDSGGGSNGWGDLLSSVQGGYQGYKDAVDPRYTSNSTFTSQNQPTIDAITGRVMGQPANPVTAQQVAGFTPDQLNAFGMLRSNVGMGSGIQNAVNANAATNAGGITPGQISGFMNPAVDAQIKASDSDINYNRQVQQLQNNSSAEAAGAFGGDRQAVQRGVTDAAASRTAATTDAGIRANAYNTAANTAAASRGLSISGNSQLQSALESMRGNANQDASNLLTGGGIQQNNTQAGLDASHAQQLQQLGFSQQQIQSMLQLGNTLPKNTGSTRGYGPQQNPLQSFLAGLTGAGANNAAGTGLSAFLSKMFGGAPPPGSQAGQDQLNAWLNARSAGNGDTYGPSPYTDTTPMTGPPDTPTPDTNINYDTGYIPPP